MATRPFGFVRKLPSNNYQASYVGLDSQRYNAPVTFKTKTSARQWLTVEHSMILAKTWTAPGSTAPYEETPNFHAYAQRHIDIQTNHYGELLRESTKALYKRLLNTKLTKFHNQKLDEISSADIADWWAKSTQTGARTSASKAYKFLSAVLKRAVDEDHLATNPCKVKGAQSATSGRTVTVPTPAQVLAISNKINDRYSELVLIKAYTGLRFGEITELRRKDLNRVQKQNSKGELIACYEIEVSRAVTLVGDGHVVASPKSRAGIRTIEVSSRVTDAIDLVISRLPEDSEALLFPAATGGHLRHDVFMNSWRPALRRAGVEDSGFTPHSLRHFAGTQLARAGANIAEIKNWLGDSSTSAVMRYVHSTNRTGSLVENMDASF